jgi:hypothetical protein
MWLWECELRELGFRRKSTRYWQCANRFGLEEDAHLSIYTWSEELPSASSGGKHVLIELSTFHVTFEIGLENIHFYYHERLENEWEPGGHTSRGEILRLGHEPMRLRERADAVARAFVEGLRGVFHARSPGVR